MLWTHLIRWHTLLDNLCNLFSLQALETFRSDNQHKAKHFQVQIFQRDKGLAQSFQKCSDQFLQNDRQLVPSADCTVHSDILNKMLFLSLSHMCLVNKECKKQLQIDLMSTIPRRTVYKWSRLLTLNIFQLDSRHKKIALEEVAYYQGCMAGTLPRYFCSEKNQPGTRCTFLGLHLVGMCQQGK
jgi:hypothetical protein